MSAPIKWIECVPNFSEGRDLTVVTAIRDAIAAVPGVSILHVTADASHNRSVITFVAPMDTMVEAAVAGIRVASERIDLSAHRGVHPRMGAADVVPFIPLDGATMDDCIAIARAVGERVGRELAVPVFLYERAATRPTRRNLADVRRGGFEVLGVQIGSDPEREPDFGPHRIHPTAGAVAIGARPFLIAFNVYLGGADQLPVAREVARAIRASSGGLPAVKALALEVDGQAQVSMNLVDLEQTSLATAYHTVAAEARARGADMTWSEIIGLIPERALFDVATHALRLREPIEDHVLERKLLDVRAANAIKADAIADAIDDGIAPEQTLRGYVHAVGAATPAPGGGSTAAYVGALAAALVKMVAELTLARERFANVHDEMRAIIREADELANTLERLSAEDTEAYRAVVAAKRRPVTTDDDAAAKSAAVREALLGAMAVPRTVARLAMRVAELAADVTARGNPNAASDAAAASQFAASACRVAALNVHANAHAIGADLSKMTDDVRVMITKTISDAEAEVDRLVASLEEI